MKFVNVTSSKSETGSEKSFEDREPTLTDKWTFSVINPNSLRDLVNRFGIQEVASSTGLGPWSVARMIENG